MYKVVIFVLTCCNNQATCHCCIHLLYAQCHSVSVDEFSEFMARLLSQSRLASAVACDVEELLLSVYGHSIKQRGCDISMECMYTAFISV